MKLPAVMTDADVVAAIRAEHLQVNIGPHDREPEEWGQPEWDHASVDPGGTIFGPGPYLKVPIVGGECDGTVQRVYAPERLRQRIAQRWRRSSQVERLERERDEARASLVALGTLAKKAEQDAPTRTCVHGHTSRQVGCVSCVLLFAVPDAQNGEEPR